MIQYVRRFLRASAAVALLSTGLSFQPAQAGHAGNFTCRASLVRVQGSGLLQVVKEEFVVANGKNSPCVAENAALLAALNTLQLPAGLGSVRALYAETTNADHHAATAAAGVLDVTLNVPGVGIVEVDVLTSQAAARCEAGKPELSGSSRVVGLRINGGQPINVSQHQDIDLLGAATIHLNEQHREPNRITQRALEIDVPGVVNIVVAESVADFTGNPCATGGGNGGGERFPGWMTGGGYVAEPGTRQDHNGEGNVEPGTRAQHAFSIDCFYPTGDDPGRKDHLVAQWFDDASRERAMFRTEGITDAACTFDPSAGTPNPPNSNFNTIEGSGTGTCKVGGLVNVPATVDFRFTDGGEPQRDYTSIKVTSPLGPLGCNYTVEGYLDGGNHQAHQTRAQRAAPAA